MKKFLIHILFFLTVSFVSNYLLFVLVKSYLNKHSNFRITRYIRDKTNDYFVLGNSRAVNSISEKVANEELKFDLINLSFNGTPYINTLDFLVDINQNNKGKVILLEITSLLQNTEDNSYSFYISDIPEIRKRYDATPYKYFHLLRMNNELFLRNIYYLNRSDNDWVNNNFITTSIIKEANQAPKFSLISDTVQFKKRLDILQKICDKNNNTLVFFLAPYLPNFLEKIKDINQLKLFMHGYHFVDLNLVSLPQNAFADRIHTNKLGANLLTRTLLYETENVLKKSKRH
jgi:hypothetical protein